MPPPEDAEIITKEPVPADELPEPNNELPNESILMEGCRLLDEGLRPDGTPAR